MARPPGVKRHPGERSDGKRQRRERGSISVEEILSGAFDVAADVSIDNLSMIRGSYGRAAVQGAIQKLEPPVAALVRAGLSSEDAFDTYSAIATHVRGTVIMERLQDKMSGIAARQDGERNLIDPAATPFIAEATGRGHRMGVADDINFEYVLECILDHAEGLSRQA